MFPDISSRHVTGICFKNDLACFSRAHRPALDARDSLAILIFKPGLERVALLDNMSGSSIEPIDEPQVAVELSSAEITGPRLFQGGLVSFLDEKFHSEILPILHSCCEV